MFQKCLRLIWSGLLVSLMCSSLVWGIIAQESLVGYWAFEEGGGDTALDSSKNGHHGTIVNALHVAGGWNDEGAIICSDVDGVDVDDWDAIDPSTLTAADGTRWMAFGSFSSGIKLIRLDSEGVRASDEFYALAERVVEPRAIKAPFLMARDPYYYLFVSFDWCCRGVDSTYNIRVGRSSEVVGPYVDRDGVPMLEFRREKTR